MCGADPSTAHRYPDALRMDNESAGSDEADSDDGDLDGMCHDGDDVQ